MWRSGLVLLVSVYLAGLSLVSCGSERDSLSHPEVVTIPGRWATASAENLDKLLASGPLIFVGTVSSLDELVSDSYRKAL